MQPRCSSRTGRWVEVESWVLSLLARIASAAWAAVVVHENQTEEDKLIGSCSEPGSGGALSPAENFHHGDVCLRLGAGGKGRPNRDCFSTAFRPRNKSGLIGAREPLQIYPGVVRAHIRIDERACRIEHCLLLHAGKLLVRGFFGLPR